MARSAKQIFDDLEKAVGKGLEAAAVSLAGVVKDVVSEPAPRKTIYGTRGKSAGVKYYRATTKAMTMAPPRKLTGRLRSSITWQKAGTNAYRVGTNVIYARRLEFGFPRGNKPHPFLEYTLDQIKDQLGRIIGDTAQGGP